MLRFVFCVMVCAAWSGFAEVKLPRVLGSHMVLQRGMAVPVWGTAEPGEKITVTFRDQTKTTVVDAEGKWRVDLDPLQVGEPATLRVNAIELTDVLVGEVWVGSGQSNIDSPVNEYTGQDPVLRAAKEKTYPQLRLYHSWRGNGWREANHPDVIGGTSAQLFYFGMLLQEKLGVPVGVMEGAVAGSPSAPFLPQEGFEADASIQAALQRWDNAHPFEERQKNYETDLAKWKDAVTAAMAPETPDFEKVPREILEKHRKPWAPRRAVDRRTGDAFDKHVRPMIPYAIRGVLWDQGEGGAGFEHELGIWQPQTMRALIPAWRKLWGQGDFPWLYVQKPSGGGCALDPQDPVNAGAMAFGPLPEWVPDNDYFSWLRREAYSVAAENTNTFLVITSDLAPGVHPPNKSGYAARDVLVALGAVYGKPLEYYGPKYASMSVEDNTLRIAFTHVGKGLVVPEGQPLQGFCIAGEDRRFHWADAKIDGDTVVLSSPKVTAPVAARYAWYWPLTWANLFNKDGLPAIGFATDRW